MPALFVVCPTKSVIEVFDVNSLTKTGEIVVPCRPHQIIQNIRDEHLAYVTIPCREGSSNEFVGEGHEIVTVDLHEKKIKDIYNLRPNHSRPCAMQIGAQSASLYVTCQSNKGELLRMDTKNDLEIVCSIGIHTASPHSLTILPSETKGYISSRDASSICVVDLHSNEFVAKISSPSKCASLCCSEDGQWLFVSSGSTSTSMSVLDTNTDRIVYEINLSHSPLGFHLSPCDPSLIYVRQHDRSSSRAIFEEIFFQTKQVGRKILLGQNPLDALISKNGKLAFVACVDEHRVDIVDLDQMDLILSLPTSPSPHGLILHQ